MCIGCMHFREPHAEVKQKNYHNSPNVQPIISYFLGRLQFMKSHLLGTLLKQLYLFYLFCKFLPKHTFHLLC